MTHKGIDHLSALVAFAVTLGVALRKAGEDGKIGFSDAFTLWPAIKQAPSAFREIGEVPSELVDLDAPEAEALVQMVEARFGDLIPSERTQDIVDAALGLVPQLANLLNTVVNPPPKAEAVGDESPE